MVEKKWVPINCDCGEGIPGVNDEELIRRVDACNIAIGGHAGERISISKCVDACREYGTLIGAHTSYPDRLHFGRRSVTLTKSAFKEALLSQFDLMASVLGQNNLNLNHIKAHGALYHDLSIHYDLADTYLEVVQSYWGNILLLAMSDSPFVTMALERGLPVWQEAFPDRAYVQKNRLLERQEEGAVISDIDCVIQQLVYMNQGKIKLYSGQIVESPVDTCCLHGDHPNTLSILEAIRYHFNLSDYEG